MTNTAVICDTGALLDYLAARAPDHRAFREAIDRSRARYVPGLVLAEVDYFLRRERAAMRALIGDLRRGAFTYAAPTLDLLHRAMEIDRQYADLDLGLVDSTVIALAEELGVRRLATRDLRDFSAIRFADGSGFEFVVEPRRPERGRQRGSFRSWRRS